MTRSLSWLSSFLRGATAPFLILVTPFAVFLRYHEYDFSRPEVIIWLLAMAGLALLVATAAQFSRAIEILAIAGLLTLFVDLQFDPPKGTIGSAATFFALASGLWILRQHAARIVTLMMATVLASSLILPGASAVDVERARQARVERTAPTSDGLPLILHVIVDEHIGVEGMPADLTPAAFEDDLRSFYRRHDFLLFGRAYSEYWNSDRSIAHLVNLQPGGYVPALLAPGTRTTWAVTRNAYFNRLAEIGYAIRAYQSDYLDVCADKTSEPACQTYVATSLRPLAPVSLPASQKAVVVAGMYLNQSNLYTQFRELYKATRRRLRPNVQLPAWNWERDKIGPLSSMHVLEAVAEDLSTATRGQFVFAHLMMPHYPYVYDAGCRLRPTGQWLERMDREAPPGTSNTPASRATRYSAYFEQARCTLQKLERLIAAIPPALERDAIVIIQGDHGSRIGLVEPEGSGSPRLSASDYVDSYSTLFAVRSPSLEAGYDTRLAPITCILQTLVLSSFRSVSALDACAAPPRVFMSAGSRTVAMPLPAFGRESDERVASRGRADRSATGVTDSKIPWPAQADTGRVDWPIR